MVGDWHRRQVLRMPHRPACPRPRRQRVQWWCWPSATPSPNRRRDTTRSFDRSCPTWARYSPTAIWCGRRWEEAGQHSARRELSRLTRLVGTPVGCVPRPDGAPRGAPSAQLARAQQGRDCARPAGESAARTVRRDHRPGTERVRRALRSSPPPPRVMQLQRPLTVPVVGHAGVDRGDATERTDSRGGDGTVQARGGRRPRDAQGGRGGGRGRGAWPRSAALWLVAAHGGTTRETVPRRPVWRRRRTSACTRWCRCAGSAPTCCTSWSFSLQACTTSPTFANCATLR